MEIMEAVRTLGLAHKYIKLLIHSPFARPPSIQVFLALHTHVCACVCVCVCMRTCPRACILCIRMCVFVHRYKIHIATGIRNMCYIVSSTFHFQNGTIYFNFCDVKWYILVLYTIY